MKKTTPFILMPHKDYDKLFLKNTKRVFDGYVVPDISYENGKEKESFYDSIVEIRMGEYENRFYVYSSFNWRLYVTESMITAQQLFNKEIKMVNKAMRENNERSKKDSIKKIEDETKIEVHINLN